MKIWKGLTSMKKNTETACGNCCTRSDCLTDYCLCNFRLYSRSRRSRKPFYGAFVLYYCRSYFGVADFILHRKNAGEAYNGRIFTGTGYGNGKRQLTILCPPFSFNIYRTFYFINTLAVQCTAGTVQLKHKIPRKTEIGKIPALFRQISEHARFYPLWLSAGF